MKRLVLVTAAISLGATTLVSAAPAAADPASAIAKVTWEKCPVSGPGDPMNRAECAQLPVPLDYRKPNGRKISIAISRIKHTDKANYKGILLVNPGGPGGSGLRYSAGLASWLAGAGHPETAASYDIIGFDPRGVGASKPALVCDEDFGAPTRPDYVPRDRREERVWKAKSKAYAADCARRFGWLLPHMRTTDAARDMESIRRALGAPKLNYYGFSYGTYLGATYGTLFPKRVGRFVMDGNVDVRDVWYRGQLEQNKAFERNIKLWFSWMAEYDELYELGDTAAKVEKAYYKARAAARDKPIGGLIGPSELDDIVLTAGYTTAGYQPLAEVLSAWIVRGDAEPILGWLSEYDDNGFAVYLAVQAADARWPRSWRTWHDDAVGLYRSGYRFLTWSNVWYNAPIAYWPFQGGPALKINGKGMNEALLVQSSLDAATPYPGGLQMHKVLPSRLIVEVGGKTHSNTLNGNACLDDRVAAYLNDGSLPRERRGPDAYCAAVPELNDPDPTAVTLKSAPGSTGGLDELRADIGRP